MLNPYESPQFDAQEDLLPAVAMNRERFVAFHLAMYLAALIVVAGVTTLRDGAPLWWPLTTSSWNNYGMVALSACGVGAVLLALYHLIAGKWLFPRSSGHWLLIYDGLAWALNQPLEFRYWENYIPSTADPGQPVLNHHPSDWVLLLRSLFHLITAVLIAAVIWKGALSPWWRRYAVCRLAYACWCVGFGLFFPSSIVWLYLCLVISATLVGTYSVAVAKDVQNRREFDYLHWLGIGVETYMYVLANVAYAFKLLRYASAIPE
jgi:hypothetical protein